METIDVIEREMCSVIAQYLDLNPSQVTPVSTLNGDLGLDSMDVLTIVDRVSESLGLELDIDLPEDNVDVPLDGVEISVRALCSVLHPR